jgi:hypothetical protein
LNTEGEYPLAAGQIVLSQEDNDLCKFLSGVSAQEKQNNLNNFFK